MPIGDTGVRDLTIHNQGIYAELHSRNILLHDHRSAAAVSSGIFEGPAILL